METRKKDAFRRLASGLGYAVGLFCLAAVANHLGLGPWPLLRSIVCLALIYLPAGYLLTRSLGRGGFSSGERFTLAIAIGYGLAPPLYYALNRVHAVFLTPVAFLSLFLAAVWSCRASTNFTEAPIITRRRPDFAGGWIFALLGISILGAAWGSAAFVTVKGGIAFRQTPDHLIHLAYLWEMLRGIPPAQLPTAAGLPFPPYHIFAYLPGIILNRYGNVDLPVISFAVFPLVNLTLFAGMLYLLVRLRTGSRSIAAAVLPATLVVMNVFEMARRNWLVRGRSHPLGFFLRSPSGAAGMIIWGAIICLLLLYRHQKDGKSASAYPLLLAAVLGGLSYFFKAQMFLLFGGGFLVMLGFFWLRDRDWSYAVAAMVFLMVFGAIYLSWRSERPIAHLFFAPGIFAKLYVYPALARSQSVFENRLLDWFKAFPAGLGWLAAAPLGLGRLLHFSPLVALFFVRGMRRWRRLPPADSLILAVLLLAVIMAYFLGDAGLNGRFSGHAFREAGQVLPFLATVIDVVYLSIILFRFTRHAGWMVLALIVSISLVLAPALYEQATRIRQKRLIPLSSGFINTLNYLRDKTPLDAVVSDVLTGAIHQPGKKMRRQNKYPFVAALAGRRPVLEYYSKGIDPKRDRVRDLRRLFKTNDFKLARALVRRYGIQYLVEFESYPLRLPAKTFTLEFDSGDVRLYRTDRN